MVISQFDSNNEQQRNKINLLVVDDSAVMRQFIIELFSHQPNINVIAVSDPIIALEKMKQVRPNVILLDLEMPRMDGLTFLRKIMASDPIPTVICSALVGQGANKVINALIAEGAIDVIAKPKLGIRSFLEESSVLFTDIILSAAQAHIPSRLIKSTIEQPQNKTILPIQKATLSTTTDKIVAIGASTGGTEALRALLETMPVDAPGIVIVQHMPAGFTTAFAERLNKLCQIEVKEASSGDQICYGQALIAPGNRHLLVHRSGARYLVEIKDGPLVSRHRPSVNLLFSSVAQSARANAIGVIMTGMGDDGAEGLLAMKEAGAFTIAQDEASCVVFGMPKEAILRGAVNEVLPLLKIAPTILKKIK